MKTHALLVAIALLLPTQALAGPSKRQKRKPAPRPALRIDTSKIIFAKAKPVRAKPTVRPKKVRKVPAPLPPRERVKAIQKVRTLAANAGVVLAPLPAPSPTPNGGSGDGATEANQPIVLTPDKPRQGNNWLGIRLGSSAPGGFLENGSNPAFDLRQYGYYRMTFGELTPGSTYLLDCTVENSATRVWSLSGPVNATTKAQAGHLLFGFTATSAKTSLTLIPDDIIHVSLFRCELIKAG